ncbi:MAG: ferrochelatase [Pseudomonadota bacterium]|nr:ferrochelatase [Pseudomonadota bacterium]
MVLADTHPKQVKLRTTILLINLGTPEKPSYFSILSFLREFLSDKRVININKLLWYPILYGFILPFRSYSSSKKYAQVFTKKGMPLAYLSKQLQKKVNNEIQRHHDETEVKLCMRYGKNNIKSTLNSIKKIPHKELIVIPLFPQYSATTSASIFDEVAKSLKQWNFIPNYRFIRDYCNEKAYIQALITSIQEHWNKNKQGEILLFTYHGLPEKNLLNGDPYSCYCHKTTRLVTEGLNLPPDRFKTVFQSRFGPTQWLKPYTEETLIEMANRGIKRIDIIAPSFAVDCLETIDEIKREYGEVFINHGGKSLNYIEALNDSNQHISLITNIIKKVIS